MHPRTFWTALTSMFAGAFLAKETLELSKPAPQRAEDSGTYTAWWRWLLGINPRHWRRFLLVPLFVTFWGWFPGHLIFDWIGPPRFGHARHR